MLKPDIDEALRYLGAADAPEDLRRRTREAGEALARLVQPRCTWRVYGLERREEGFHLTGTGILLTGVTAARMLADSARAALLACTLGALFDRKLLALQARDMAEAALWDACGSALVEAGCDRAEQELRARFPELFLTDRFSPGYGDLPLELQPDICAALDAERRLGVHVSESLLMNPVKTVTAVIGLSERPQAARIRGCGYCPMGETCQLRKGGTRCEAGN